MDSLLELNRTTYGGIVDWTEDPQRELIDGFYCTMKPDLDVRSLAITHNLEIIFRRALYKKRFRFFITPFPVLLDAPERGTDLAENVVQPELVVVCDRDKIKPHGCEGVPDLVVEILSPSSHTRDYIDKLRLYERFGVKEYWIVDPDGLRLHVLRPDEEKRFKVVASLTPEDSVGAEAVQGLSFALGEVFADLP